MNNRWKEIMDCVMSQSALLLLFTGLIIAKVAGDNNFKVIETAAYLISAAAFVLWLIWVSVVISTKRSLKPLAVRYRLITESICNILYLSYLYLAVGIIGMVFWIPFLMLIEIQIIKEWKEQLN